MTKLDIKLELQNNPKTVSALQKTPKYSDVVKGITKEEGVADDVILRQPKNSAIKYRSIAQISREKPFGTEKMKPKINYAKPNHIDKYDVYDRMNNQYQNFGRQNVSKQR